MVADLIKLMAETIDRPIEPQEHPWKPGEGVGEDVIPYAWETEETWDEQCKTHSYPGGNY